MSKYFKSIFKSETIIMFLSLLGLLLSLLYTNPSENSFIYSLLPLLLLWLFIYTFLKTALRVFLKNVGKVFTNILSIAVSSTIVLAIMFSALGNLTFFDVVLLLSLVGLAAFYFSRTWPES